MVAPSILSAYIGQAAYLTKYPGDVYLTFYKSIPSHLYWPMFVVAVAVAVIARQAMISEAFAIISQSLRLGCFPRVKVIHTSTKYAGQVCRVFDFFNALGDVAFVVRGRGNRVQQENCEYWVWLIFVTRMFRFTNSSDVN
ncbi:hypothetical protein Droror1_Dr00014834 [Drosera rotundifolia]